MSSIKFLFGTLNVIWKKTVLVVLMFGSPKVSICHEYSGNTVCRIGWVNHLFEAQNIHLLKFEVFLSAKISPGIVANIYYLILCSFSNLETRAFSLFDMWKDGKNSPGTMI